MSGRRNVDESTVKGFGEEWNAFDQSGMSAAEYNRLFDRYFHLFPFDRLPAGAEGFDLGCGSGRWALGVAPKVGKLHCIDPAEKALSVAWARLQGQANVCFHHAAADSIPLIDGSQDFGYSLGVLHHIPDTARALRDAVCKLKPGAPFLLYLYYRLDQRPLWFYALWRASDLVRRGVSRLPFRARRLVTDAIAVGVYWPLSRFARLAAGVGRDVINYPLSSYRSLSLYSLRTDALDRFGTRLEKRFTQAEVDAMMRDAGLDDLRFSEREPYWVAVGWKAQNHS